MDADQPNPPAKVPGVSPSPATAPEPTAPQPQDADPVVSPDATGSQSSPQPNPTIVEPTFGASETRPEPTLQQPVTISPPANQFIDPKPAVPTHAGSGSSAPLGGAIKDRSRLAFLVVAALFAFMTAATVYFVLASRSSQNEVADLKREIAVITADTHDLPEGAIQVSECIPNMGFHYIDRNSDPRFGPYYLVNKQGKVIGFEYMFNESMLTSIPAGIDLEVLLTDGPISLHGWQYETIEFARSPSGHPGFEDDHIDVHIYTVTPEEQKKSCE